MKTRGPHSFLPLFMAVCCCLFPRPLRAQWTPMNPVRNVQQQADGVVLTMGTGTLKIQVCSDSIIRVLYSPTASFPKRTDLCGDQRELAGRQMDDAVHRRCRDP